MQKRGFWNQMLTTNVLGKDVTSEYPSEIWQKKSKIAMNIFKTLLILDIFLDPNLLANVETLIMY